MGIRRIVGIVVTVAVVGAAAWLLARVGAFDSGHEPPRVVPTAKAEIKDLEETVIATGAVSPVEPLGHLDDLDAHVGVALVYRSDLNQARLQVENNNLDVVKTKNGLLPRLDLFATLGRTWYSHYPTGTGYSDPTSYDASAGINFDYPIYNRAAKAAYGSSLASRSQSVEAVANLTQLVEFDVRSTYQTALQAEEQITATAATLQARQAALQVEQERYRVGKSTSLLVSLAQQEVLNSQIAQATAVAGYLKGLVDLYRIEGSLLERRGVVSMDYPPKAPKQ